MTCFLSDSICSGVTNCLWWAYRPFPDSAGIHGFIHEQFAPAVIHRRRTQPVSNRRETSTFNTIGTEVLIPSVLRKGVQMAISEIVCVNVEEVFPDHLHIVNVGIRGPSDSEIISQTVSKIRFNLEEGESFFVMGNISRQHAMVDLGQCSCGYLTIRSFPKDRRDDDLQDIRPCN